MFKWTVFVLCCGIDGSEYCVVFGSICIFLDGGGGCFGRKEEVMRH
jgi:hypothetical protein